MDENIPKQIFHLKNLPTKSLILYPTRAHVTREIQDVVLQAGVINELEIYGLSPMVDEASISIDGTGQATITDITVDLVPNKEDFEDIYPKDDDLSEDERPEPDSLDSSDPKVKELDVKIEANVTKLEDAQNLYANGDRQLENLENYLNSIHSKETAVSASTLTETLKVYQEERTRIERLKSDSQKRLTELYKEQEQLNYQKYLAQKEELAQKKKVNLEKERAREKRERKREEKRKERERIDVERKKFWANKVYRVVVRLEVASATPGTSRRNSQEHLVETRSILSLCPNRPLRNLTKLRVNRRLRHPWFLSISAKLRFGLHVMMSISLLFRKPR